MFRYIGIAWNPTDELQCETARQLRVRLQNRTPHWHEALHCSGLAIFCADALRGASESLPLRGGNAIVLGTLFPRPLAGAYGDPARRANLDSIESTRIINSGGRHLVSAYWGRYIAFIRDEACERTWVLRDPSGGLPCLRTVHRGLNVFCSRVEDCLDLGLPRCTVNWDYVGAHAIFPLLQSHETGLNEFTQLQPGRALELRDRQVREMTYWDPVRIAQSDVIERPDIAAVELRRAARYCTHAWASRHDSILHHLSGGLDSSIVLGCLAAAPNRPQITCVNYFSGNGDGDERAYARLAARHADSELIESQRDPAAALTPLLHIAPTASPLAIRNCNVNVDDLESAWACERDATALFGGEGGDALFYQNPAIEAAADYAHSHGMSTGLFRVALHAAQLANVSIWHVLRNAFAKRSGNVRRKLADTVHGTFRLVSAAAVDAAGDSDRFRLSNIDPGVAVPPGKRWHIDYLTIAQQFYSPFGCPGDPEPVEPLTSQPLVELCLRIPTYLSIADTWDRAVARRAFGPEVPAAILWRRTKGGIDTYVKDLLRSNTRFVREMLLDGLLIQRGLLDKTRLEAALGEASIRTRANAAEIFDHLIAEAWLRRWQGDHDLGCYQRLRTRMPTTRPEGLALAPSK